MELKLPLDSSMCRSMFDSYEVQAMTFSISALPRDRQIDHTCTDQQCLLCWPLVNLSQQDHEELFLLHGRLSSADDGGDDPGSSGDDGSVALELRVPAGITKYLRPYQQEGVRFLCRCRHGSALPKSCV